MDETSESEYVRRLVAFALAEDIGSGDVTSNATIKHDRPAEAHLLARQDGILSGCEVFDAVFRELDKEVVLAWKYEDGDRLSAGKVVATVNGKLSVILAAERVALNFLARMSGIATLTRRFVEKVDGHQSKITDTRKTTPGLRHLEKYAVKCGGGENHRIGLYDMILVKDNHIKAAGGLLDATKAALVYAIRSRPRLAVEVEAQTIKDAAMAAGLSVDRVMLDNMSAEDMTVAVDRIRKISADSGKFISIEASGNVSLDNVHAIAETGVDFISVGALTHSAPAFDFSLLVQ
jgi:nicotinate-nucleotide pyrophosphorylase (carboxylating)